jgi:Ca-activated chloride channel family protein
MEHLRKFVLLSIILLFGLCTLEAQNFRHQRPLAANVIMPQTNVFAITSVAGVQITRVNVGIGILEQAATVTMEILLRNYSISRLEAELIIPVPMGVVIKGFTFEGAGAEPTVQLLPKAEAHRIYDEIVAKVRDPALLEFVGYNLIRSSVFPVEAGGRQKIRVSYEQLLPADGNRVDFVLPRSESLQQQVPWDIAIGIQAKKAISTVYSPSHKIETRRVHENHVRAQLADDAAQEPGPFRISYLLEDKGVTASLFAYPDAKNGGYFLLLAGLPAALPTANKSTTLRREVTMVIDRSGSMRGEKMAQVQEAVVQILNGLDDGEAFNIIVYNHVVDVFAPAPVIKRSETLQAARAYLAAIMPSGGTNIHDALLEALRQKPVAGMLPIILFLTDGLATIGQTAEVDIRNTAGKANVYQRRIFTFGVGLDVNTPLLEAIAAATRATTTFIFPQEDVRFKVAQVFKRLSGPVLADITLTIHDAANNTGGRVQDVIPAVLPDLFAGDQLVLTGRYIGEQPLVFEIGGQYLGSPKKFRYTFGLERATVRNAFVPRLWASRQIATLIAAIRQLGADSPPAAGTTPNPRFKELVDEVIRLSTEFGILTEYTAFLAREGTDLARREQVSGEAQKNFIERAWNSRSGLSSVNQDINAQEQKQLKYLNNRNSFWDARMNRVTIGAVQQIQDLSFYQRSGRWVDSRMVHEEGRLSPKKVIVFGSEEFKELALKLAEQGRQGCLALSGEILVIVDGELTLIKMPTK